jgi:hypothetical protein
MVPTSLNLHMQLFTTKLIFLDLPVILVSRGEYLNKARTFSETKCQICLPAAASSSITNFSFR